MSELGNPGLRSHVVFMSLEGNLVQGWIPQSPLFAKKSTSARGDLDLKRSLMVCYLMPRQHISNTSFILLISFQLVPSSPLECPLIPFNNHYS